MERTEDQAKAYQTFEDLEAYQFTREFRNDVLPDRSNSSSVQRFNE